MVVYVIDQVAEYPGTHYSAHAHCRRSVHRFLTVPLLGFSLLRRTAQRIKEEGYPTREGRALFSGSGTQTYRHVVTSTPTHRSKLQVLPVNQRIPSSSSPEDAVRSPRGLARLRLILHESGLCSSRTYSGCSPNMPAKSWTSGLQRYVSTRPYLCHGST